MLYYIIKSTFMLKQASWFFFADYFLKINACKVLLVTVMMAQSSWFWKVCAWTIVLSAYAYKCFISGYHCCLWSLVLMVSSRIFSYSLSVFVSWTLFQFLHSRLIQPLVLWYTWIAPLSDIRESLCKAFLTF